MEITSLPDDDLEPEKIDFNSPEDVLIEVIADEFGGYGDPAWKGFSIEACTILNGKDGITGAASYEQAYGSFIEGTIMEMIECPKAEGFYVVEGVTGRYSKGDGWMTDDDMEFYFENVRPATPEEAAQI